MIDKGNYLIHWTEKNKIGIFPIFLIFVYTSHYFWHIIYYKGVNEMVKNDSRIIIRISSEDKQILFDYCSKNSIKVSELLRKCTLNYIKENENK